MQLQTLLAASIICQLQTLETIHLFITEMYIKKENLRKKLYIQYVGTWFPWFQGHPLISGAMPLESGAGFA